MQNELVGYIIGALEEDECEGVEAQLEADAQLQSDLEILRRSVDPLSCGRQHHVVPLGLASRTCDIIDSNRSTPSRGRADVPLSSAFEDSAAPLAHRASPADIAVAVGILIAAALLIVPAVSHSRFNAQLVACQNNLREIGSAIHKFADRDADQRIPSIPVDGKLSVAGVYAPKLLEAGLVTDPQVFICAGSGLAESNEPIDIPTYGRLVDLERNPDGPNELESLLTNVGGSYAFHLGYDDHGAYRTVSLKPDRDAPFVLMADTPCPNTGWMHSRNHGGHGQNVLFDDAHVDYVVGCRGPGCIDTDFYHNDDGEVAAGKHQHDSVVGGCKSRPQR